MKKGLFAIAAGIVLLVSCNQTKDTASHDQDDHMGEAKRNAEHTKEIYHAIETGDMSKLDSFVAKDITDHEGNNGKDIVGLDSLKAFLSTIHNYVDGVKFEMLSDATSHDGNYHFAMVRMTGKSKENPWGMPVGKELDDTSIDVVKIKDGKMTEHWSFTSQKDLMEMMTMMQGNGAGGNPPLPPPTEIKKTEY